jgi:hypothetical protein
MAQVNSLCALLDVGSGWLTRNMPSTTLPQQVAEHMQAGSAFFFEAPRLNLISYR